MTVSIHKAPEVFLGIGLIAGALVFEASAVKADTPMTAGVVLDRMGAEEFAAYTAGIAEGLAYERYRRGGVEAMQCVYDWFYSGGPAARQIDQAFQRFPDHFPGPVMAALVNRQCGE